MVCSCAGAGGSGRWQRSPAASWDINSGGGGGRDQRQTMGVSVTKAATGWW